LASKASKRAARRRAASSRAEGANDNRGGRPRKGDVVRYPNGRIDYSATEKAPQIMATVKAARERHYGRPDQGQEMGYALGRLYLSGKLDKNADRAALMLEAGNRMGLDYERYYRLTGIPSPNPRAMDMTRVRGIGGDTAATDAKAAANRMMAVEQALGCVDTQGRPVMGLTKRLIIKDEDAANWTPSMVGHLRKGLLALVEMYGLTTPQS